MKALLCKQWGHPSTLTIEEVAEPVAKDNEAVVEVKAAAVNFPDALIVQKLYQIQPELPFSPGGECAGVVKSVGSKVKNVKVGDRVLGLTGWGAFAEQVAVNSAVLMPIPAELDDITASAFVFTYGTSYHAIKDRAALQAGETLVVLGAAGGVGIAAIEIGKALGAKVIACCSTQEKLDVCKQHGADEVINYETEDLKTRIRELTDGKGADVIYDPVGGKYSEPAIRSCNWRGRHVVVGFANGEIPKIPLNLTLLKGCSIVGVFWGDFARREPHEFLTQMIELFELLQAGKLKPHVAGTYSLENAKEAIIELMDRKVAGKLVVVP